MIWKSILIPRAIAPASARWSVMSGYALKTAETVSDFVSVVHNLAMDVRDSYRPELHYMRGPGPKWRAKHQPWLTLIQKLLASTGCHRCIRAVVTRLTPRDSLPRLRRTRWTTDQLGCCSAPP